jgi:hypothetical protein
VTGVYIGQKNWQEDQKEGILSISGQVDESSN